MEVVLSREEYAAMNPGDRRRARAAGTVEHVGAMKVLPTTAAPSVLVVLNREQYSQLSPEGRKAYRESLLAWSEAR